MNSARVLRAACLAALMLAPAALARAEERPAGYKSPDGAFFYSFGATAIPVGAGAVVSGDAGAALFIAAVVFGPSAGHFYADRPGHAWSGIAVRGAAVGAVAVGAPHMFDSGDHGGTDALIVLGSLACITWVIYDLATAPGSARKHNAELEHAGVTVSPAILGPERAPGLRVDVAF